MPPLSPTHQPEENVGVEMEPPEETPETRLAALRHQLHAMITEVQSLESQKSVYILRTMSTPLSLLYAFTYAICLKVKPFGRKEAVVHRLMIGGAVGTFVLIVSLIPVAYFIKFDLTRPFGQPVNRVFIILLSLITAIMTVLSATVVSIDHIFFIFSLLIIAFLLLVFAFTVQWAFHDNLEGGNVRYMQMPEDCATHGAVLLSLEIFCIFLYVLLAMRIYCFVLAGNAGDGY